MVSRLRDHAPCGRRRQPAGGGPASAVESPDSAALAAALGFRRRVRPRPAPLSAPEVSGLQRTLGNRAATRLMTAPSCDGLVQRNDELPLVPVPPEKRATTAELRSNELDALLDPANNESPFAVDPRDRARLRVVVRGMVGLRRYDLLDRLVAKLTSAGDDEGLTIVEEAREAAEEGGAAREGPAIAPAEWAEFGPRPTPYKQREGLTTQSPRQRGRQYLATHEDSPGDEHPPFNYLAQEISVHQGSLGAFKRGLPGQSFSGVVLMNHRGSGEAKLFLFPVDPGAHVRSRPHDPAVRTRLYGTVYEGALAHQGGNPDRMSHLNLYQMIEGAVSASTGEAKAEQWNEEVSPSNRRKSTVGFNVIRSETPPHVFNFTSTSMNYPSFQYDKEYAKTHRMAEHEERWPPEDWATKIATAIDALDLSEPPEPLKVREPEAPA